MKDWRTKDSQYPQEQKKYPHPVPSRDYILSVLKSEGKSLSFAGLTKLFGLNRGEKETLNHRLKAMLRDGQLEERSNGKLCAAKVVPAIKGKIFAHAEGYGFFIPEDKAETDGHDLYLAYREMSKVMHGDIVEARILTQRGKGKKDGKKEGKVVRVIEHASTTVIGRLINDFGIRIVKAENRRIHHKIMVSNLDDFDVKDNEIVEIKITSYPKANKPILGEIIQVLGDKLDAGMEIDVAIANHNLPNEWPDEVTHQTISIPDKLAERDYHGRVDLRDLPLVTIDGITARDFDDAVCAKPTSKGFKIYVAIADVAHYVRKGSPLDKEATKRATSVYFPNRVIPMLPEKLSNGLCSLNPKVDRLCMVCEILIDGEGEIIRSKFYDAVMHSHARLTYETVEGLLFSDNSTLDEEYAHLLHSLKHLKAAYQILRKQRDRRGAIGFRTVEPEFEFDAAGKIDRIVGKVNLQSYQLIEEFMVRANVCAAKFLIKQKGKNKPIALFRNHEGPNEEKLEKLVASLAQEGVKLAKTESVQPKQLADIIEQIQSHDNFGSIQMMILRSMRQALYEPINIGHFGLALDNYAHFTSPIRRYPDLLVHRAIKHAIKHPKELYIYSSDDMQQLGEHCSMAERRADDASYDVIGYLKCQYMQDKLGQQFSAMISGVTNFGFFATLNGEFVDGLVHISSLDGDYFKYDEERRVLIGENSRKVYRQGDSIDIIVSSVSVDDRKITFVLTEEHLPYNGKKSGKPKKPSVPKRSRKKRR